MRTRIFGMLVCAVAFTSSSQDVHSDIFTRKLFDRCRVTALKKYAGVVEEMTLTCKAKDGGPWVATRKRHDPAATWPNERWDAAKVGDWGVCYLTEVTLSETPNLFFVRYRTMENCVPDAAATTGEQPSGDDVE